MIVGRVAGTVEAVLRQISSTRIRDLLVSAIKLSEQRANIDDVRYRMEADRIRQEAKRILDIANDSSLSADLAAMVNSSAYAYALPRNIALLLIRGTPAQKNLMIPSSELNLYLNGLDDTSHELTTTLNTLKKFGISGITVPEGAISVDVIIPREPFSDDAMDFIEVNRAFVEVISLLQELTIKSADKPRLVYSSTTDLVTGFTIATGALMSFLLLYDKLLDVARKHIEFRKAIKTIRESSPQLARQLDVEEQAKETNKKNIEDAVNATIDAENMKAADNARVSEIKIAVTMKANVVVRAIANGTRVGLTTESLTTLEKTLEMQGIPYAEVQELLAQGIALGKTVDERLKQLNERVPLLTGRDHTSSQNIERQG